MSGRVTNTLIGTPLRALTMPPTSQPPSSAFMAALALLPYFRPFPYGIE